MAASGSYDVTSTEIQEQSAQRVREGSFLGPLDSSSKYLQSARFSFLTQRIHHEFDNKKLSSAELRMAQELG